MLYILYLYLYCFPSRVEKCSCARRDARRRRAGSKNIRRVRDFGFSCSLVRPDACSSLGVSSSTEVRNARSNGHIAYTRACSIVFFTPFFFADRDVSPSGIRVTWLAPLAVRRRDGVIQLNVIIILYHKRLCAIVREVIVTVLNSSLAGRTDPTIWFPIKNWRGFIYIYNIYINTYAVVIIYIYIYIRGRPFTTYRIYPSKVEEVSSEFPDAPAQSDINVYSLIVTTAAWVWPSHRHHSMYNIRTVKYRSLPKRWISKRIIIARDSMIHYV